MENAEEKKKLKEARQRALQAWYIAVKNAKLYNVNHPSFESGAQQLVTVLQDVFQVSMELSIQHNDGIFRIDDDFFLEESLTMFDLLSVLEEAKISRVLFLPGVRLDEA